MLKRERLNVDLIHRGEFAQNSILSHPTSHRVDTLGRQVEVCAANLAIQCAGADGVSDRRGADARTLDNPFGTRLSPMS
jgi:hypothetical protein